MLGNARCLDLYAGICCCHCDACCIGMVGPVITCSSNVSNNDRGSARCGDIVIGFCGHPGIIVTCSNDTANNSRGNARLTDVVVGCLIGVIVTSSQDTSNN